MTEVTLTEWNQFLTKVPRRASLADGRVGRTEKDFGWKPVRVISGDAGAQILFRRLPLGFTIGYMPKVVMSNELLSDEFWREVDSFVKRTVPSFLKSNPMLGKTINLFLVPRSSLLPIISNLPAL
jgi:peptidoglycan pentaglycine glycine transferase (the first glycine)